MYALGWFLITLSLGLPLLIFVAKFGKVIWEEREIWYEMLYDLRWFLFALGCGVALGVGLSLVDSYGGR